MTRLIVDLKDPVVSMAQRVLAEQLKNYNSQGLRVLGYCVSATTAVIIALVLWNHVTRLPMLITLFFLWFAVLLRVKSHWRYTHNPPMDSRVRHTARTTVLGTAMHGCCWGAFSLAIFVPHSLAYQCLDVAMMFGVTSGAIVVSAQYYRCFVAFAVPTLLPVVLRCFVEGTPASVGLGTAGLFGLLYNLAAGLYTFRLTATSIKNRLENMDILSELEIQKEAADTARVLAEQARVAAESANRSKSRFLAAASHDLRQPVHALSLFVSAAKQSTTEMERRFIHARIEQSVRSLEVLFDSLLDVSRLDAGILQPQTKTVALAPMLRKLAAEYAAEAREKQLQFRVRCSELIVRTDPVLLERMIRNLLTNALRYTKTGGVLLAFRKCGAYARVEVWDTGIGIALEKQAQVFEEFYQIGNPERDRRKGVGLGLAIVKGIAELLRHPLHLVSRVERGTRVTIEVPIATGNDESSSRTAALADDDDSVLFGVVIVAIDDELDVLTAIELLLKQWGCIAITAESAGQAIKKLQVEEIIPSLIVSDYRLRDGETGIATVRALRATFGGSIPALLVTGDTAAQPLRDATASGLMVLHKPLEAEQLKHALIKALASDSHRAETSHAVVSKNIDG